MRFPLIRPAVPSPERWLPYLETTYEARRYSNSGPLAVEFERRVATRFGRGRAAIGVSSCTSGLVAVLQARGVRGRVAMPSFTFAATAHAVVLAGGEPVLLDCDGGSLGLSDAAVAAAIDRGPLAAILAVRPFGMRIDLGALQHLAESADVPVIVDAAAGLGTPCEPTSSNDLTEVFSLHATKSLAIGEGGVVLVGEPEVDRVRAATNFGLSDGQVVQDGANAKMSEFHAAVALAALDEFDTVVETKVRAAAAYADRLGGHPLVEHVWPPDLAPWSIVPVLLRPGGAATDVITAAAQRELELRAYYRPLHWSPRFSHAAEGSMSTTDDISRRIVCLPAYGDMTAEELGDVIERFEQALDAAGGA